MTLFMFNGMAYFKVIREHFEDTKTLMVYNLWALVEYLSRGPFSRKC